MKFKNLFLTLFALTLITGCGSADPTLGTGDTGTAEPANTAPTPTSPSQGSGTVVSRVEQAGPVSYKIYLQDQANGTNRKGIVLLGSGNDENDPATGSLDGVLENNTANELAKLGYVAAIVAYRDEPALVAGDGGASWNSNSEMLATDMSHVADAIISTYGNGLSRNRVLTGGVSYASYALLTNTAENNTPLADTRGVLATCGATDDSTNLQLPVYSLNCSGNPEGGLNGQTLINKIADPNVQADSGYFTDGACNTHCGGDTSTWTAKLVERVQLWLP